MMKIILYIIIKKNDNKLRENNQEFAFLSLDKASIISILL